MGDHQTQPEGIFIGLLSGTSLDAVDAAAFRFEPTFATLATHVHPYPADLRRAVIAALTTPDAVRIARLGELDNAIGGLFAEAAAACQAKLGTMAAQVVGIGSHGQTLWHAPDDEPPFTWQIGDPNPIVERCGCPVVADLRRRDMAVGGQGAPLAPGFHAWRWRVPGRTRVVLNLGGIANVTRLPADPHQPVRGYDTGPANTLMDAWCQRYRDEPFDRDGAWAASARPDPGLLARLEAHPFFTRPAPKSTGRETFNLAWLDAELKAYAGALSPAVVQSTLAELTARSIASALQQEQADEVVVGGGGVHNGALMARLRALTPRPPAIQSSAAWGLDPDWVEAAAFAWIARNTLAGVPSNLPSVTGANRPVVLGGIYNP